MDLEPSAVEGGHAAAVCLAQLRMLAQLQSRLHPRPLPAIAAWLAARAGPVLATWHNRERRSGLEEQLQRLMSAGFLAPMLQLLEDPAGRNSDTREANQAARELVRIDHELAQIASGAQQRAAAAARVGQEIAAGFGLTALATALAVAALG